MIPLLADHFTSFLFSLALGLGLGRPLGCVLGQAFGWMDTRMATWLAARLPYWLANSLLLIIPYELSGAGLVLHEV